MRFCSSAWATSTKCSTTTPKRRRAPSDSRSRHATTVAPPRCRWPAFRSRQPRNICGGWWGRGSALPSASRWKIRSSRRDWSSAKWSRRSRPAPYSPTTCLTVHAPTTYARSPPVVIRRARVRAIRSALPPPICPRANGGCSSYRRWMRRRCSPACRRANCCWCAGRRIRSLPRR